MPTPILRVCTCTYVCAGSVLTENNTDSLQEAEVPNFRHGQKKTVIKPQKSSSLHVLHCTFALWCTMQQHGSWPKCCVKEPPESQEWRRFHELVEGDCLGGQVFRRSFFTCGIWGIIRHP